MALSAEQAAVNSAMDDLVTAYAAFINSLNAGDEIQVCYQRSKTGSAGKYGNASNTAYETGRKYREKLVYAATATVPMEAGDSGPLFWKVTNDAGDLT
jgi:hypothetical protein